MSFRWTPEAVEAFNQRRAEWLSKANVTTHLVDPKNPKHAAKIREVRVPERAVLAACMDVLKTHPKVAFAWRQNTGLAFSEGHAVRFSFKGCSDILGMLKGGRFLALETKATGKVPSKDQEAFLEAVRAAGGLALWVDDPDTLIAALETA